jgi:hypothetical protein
MGGLWPLFYTFHGLSSQISHGLCLHFLQIFSSHCCKTAIDLKSLSDIWHNLLSLWDCRCVFITLFANCADLTHFYQFHGFVNLMFSHTSYKSSQVTAPRWLLISGALLQLLAESAISTILYKCWDNRCIFITFF